MYRSDAACSLRINELNADTPQDEEILEFIELKAVDCDEEERIDMTGYRVLFMKGYGLAANTPEIDSIMINSINK